MRIRMAASWLMACLVLSGAEVSGLQREVRTRTANYDDAPVTLEDARVKLVQTYSAPNQFPLALADGDDVKVHRTRVRHLNRLHQQVPTYQLESHLELRNATRKTVATLQVTTVFFNAFHERIGIERESLPSAVPPRQTKTITWRKNLPNEYVFEMLFVISAVRFTDGTVWSPAEELIILP